ncbi:MAG: M15 family metallopeptidase [Canibacter sp.]
MTLVKFRPALLLGLATVLTLSTVGCAEEPNATADSKAASDTSITTKSHDLTKQPGESLSAKKKPEKPKPKPEKAEKPANNVDDANSYQVVVNKRRALNPQDYAPGDLVYPDVPNVNGQPMRAEAGAALEKMLAAASAAGVGDGVIQSGYRDYETQVIIYNRIVGELGQAGADETSARPGHSEHQTGLTVDVDDQTGCVLAACFGETPMGTWLVDHAWEYGFILRYPADKTAVTGYEYEPWHFRYVQTPVAKDMHQKGITTLEEYYGLGPAPDYDG